MKKIKFLFKIFDKKFGKVTFCGGNVLCQETLSGETFLAGNILLGKVLWQETFFFGRKCFFKKFVRGTFYGQHIVKCNVL